MENLEKQLKQFEEDIFAGKDIDITEFYMLKKFFNLLLICKNFIKSKQYDQYKLVFLFQIFHLFRVDGYDVNVQTLVSKYYLVF